MAQTGTGAAHRAQVGLLLAVVLLACTAGVGAVKELSGWEQGILTHYGGEQDGMDPSNPSFGSKEGACGYGDIPKDRWPYFSVAALSPSNQFFQSGPLDGCGMCFQIQCGGDMGGKDVCKKDSRGKPLSILVMISDKCPECEAEHIDVQSLSFAKLANPDIGRLKITYRRVECAPPEDVTVSVLDFVGSNGWLRLSIGDTGGRGAVKSVQVKSSSSGSWLPMSNTWGATWELGSAPAPPLDFKIAVDDGEEVVATGVIKQNGGISAGSGGSAIKFDTNTQFAISDPAALTVRAASGPDENADPMLVTSDTPGNGGAASEPTISVGSASASASTSVSSGQSCTDVAPPGSFTCTQQKAWGKCGEAWMASCCAATCGRCGASSSAGQGAQASASAFAQASAGGSASASASAFASGGGSASTSASASSQGRKLLLGARRP